MKTNLLLLIVLFWCAAASGQVLYSVTFEPPRHQVGERTAVGGSDAPSRVLLGRPTVRESNGVFTTQYLEFEGSPSEFGRHHGQIGFDISVDAPKYRIEFDMVVEALEFSCCEFFSVLAFGSTWHNAFDFRGGSAVAWNYQSKMDGAGGGFTHNGSALPIDVELHFRAIIEIENQRWRVTLDGQPIQPYGPYIPFHSDPGENLQSLRIYFADSRTYGDSSVGVDNIVITAVPEPTSLILSFVLGILVLVRWTFRSKSAGAE